MSRETDWIRRLEAIRDKLAEDPNADWMNEWRTFSSIIDEAAAVHPRIREWLPVAEETFGEDVIPVDRIRDLAEGAISRLKSSDS